MHQPCKTTNQEDQLIRDVYVHSCKEIERLRSWYEGEVFMTTHERKRKFNLLCKKNSNKNRALRTWSGVCALNKDCRHQKEFLPDKESYERIYKRRKRNVYYLQSRLTISWCGRIRGRSLWFLLPADLVGYPTENLREKRGNSPSATIEGLSLLMTYAFNFTPSYPWELETTTAPVVSVILESI